MQRLKAVNPNEATGEVGVLLDIVQEAFGMSPTTTQVMANSPAVLKSFLEFTQAMGEAKIGEKLHTQIKLSVSENNACEYCTSILSSFAADAGLTADDILSGRKASDKDPRTDVALKFGLSVMNEAGKVSDKQIGQVRDAGFDDQEIVEIVASVALGCFTNFLNNVAKTNLDVPKAEALSA